MVSWNVAYAPLHGLQQHPASPRITGSCEPSFSIGPAASAAGASSIWPGPTFALIMPLAACNLFGLSDTDLPAW